MENDRILFYDAIWMMVSSINNSAIGFYGGLKEITPNAGINNLFTYYLHVSLYWNVATYTRDAIYIDFLPYIQYGFNRYGNSMNWTGSIKGFYYQHTGIILHEDTYEGATGGNP